MNYTPELKRAVGSYEKITYLPHYVDEVMNCTQLSPDKQF